MLVEIVMIEKLIYFHFYYLEDSTAGTPMAHSKSTSSRPLALLPLLLDLFYFGHRFSHFFLLLPVHSSCYPSLPTKNITLLMLLENSCKGNPRGIMNKKSDY